MVERTGLLKAQWEKLDGQKGDLISRSQQYARWTVPSVCPEDNSGSSEITRSNVAIGPRLVQHLANRVVDVMFPSDRPFFGLKLDPGIIRKLEQQYGEQVGAFLAMVRKATNLAAEEAVTKLNLTKYRPVAIQSAMHQIITGNAVMRRLKDVSLVYGVKDFCIKRNLSGEPITIILRDSKFFGTIPQSMQDAIKASSLAQTYNDDTKCALYTQYTFDDNRWTEKQAVDNYDLDTSKSYTKLDVPVYDLVWDLSRGEDYGRGLVESNATLFHNVNSTSDAILDLISILSDVKFLVNPASGLDIQELNNSERGSYHSGQKDDISTPDFPKVADLAQLREQVAEWERQLSQAFLYNSGTVRDAERVTAEEIRFYVKELESSFGGLYSRLALSWQKKEADFLLSQTEFKIDGPGGKFEVVIQTGLESLSREAELDSLRLALADLQMLNTIPEDMRVAFNARKFAEFIFTQRGLRIIEFLNTQEEIQQMQQAEAQAQQQQIAAQGASNVAEAAGKKAVEGQ